MKRFLQHSICTFALIAAAVPAFAAEEDAVKYSLGGGLERTPMVSSYNADYLFDYDEASGEWTRTVTVGTTGNNYFSIFDASGKKWSYEVLAVDGDHASAKLVTPAYGNMEIKKAGVWPGIKLTITEESGTPYLQISGFTEDIPESKVWSIGGELAGDGEAWMADKGSSVFSYELAAVAAGATFHISGPGAESKTADYGFNGDPIVAGISYLLEEGGADLKFASAYTNVVILWNALTKRLSFSGTEVPAGVGELRPSSVVPANGSTYVPVSPLTQISFFYNQSENGIETIKREEGLSLKLVRDGAIYREIPSTDTKAVMLNRNNPNQLDINFEGISEAGSYSLTLPQDFIALSNMLGGTLGSEDPTQETDPAKLHNAAYTLSFTIAEMIPFKVSPEVGEVKAEELATVVITYPEGAVTKRNPSFNSSAFSTSLYYINEGAAIDSDGNSDRRTKVTDYNVSFEGNKVVLTAKSPAAIPAEADNASVRYLSLVVPAGAWLVEYEGKTETLRATTLEKYTIAKNGPVSEGNVTITPEGNQIVAADKLQTITVTYPESYKFNAWSMSNSMGKREGYTIGYLRKVASATAQEGESAGDYKLTAIDTAARTLTLECSASTTDLSAGYYTLMLTNNLFVLPDNTKNASLYFTGYQVSTEGTGVAGIDVEEAFDVYTLEGVCVKQGARDLTDLPAGLYIINGRQVMVVGK